ncbi:MAG: beta-ketoacyl synthase N-terminal-like domain-containing protein, partial [Polaribacter sp.]
MKEETKRNDFNINNEDLANIKEDFSLGNGDNYDWNEEPIAIVGLSGKYPKANTLDEFWKNLQEGKDCITEVPESRKINKDGDNGVLKQQKNWGGFIEDVDKFDPLFFKIAPSQAEMMDPQSRLFLEESWKALEDAGYNFSSSKSNKNIGVFVGSMFHPYPSAARDKPTTDLLNINTGWEIANRVSFHLGFTGPSIHVNTACSSSMTAIIQACQSLRDGLCYSAIAGGVNLNLDIHKWGYLKNQGLVGSTKDSRSFSQGDGYLPGEGVGAVLLKPLHKAESDGDHVYGLIRGWSMNHNGSGSGFGVPNPKVQSDLIKEALNRSGVVPDDIDYIEVAANGSALGDPIEIRGLSEVFSKRNEDVLIGSVKSYIGHLESASGISQLTKVLLQLKNGKIVPGLHGKKLNTHLGLEGSSLKINRALKLWENKKPQLAIINNFGAGGSNTHIIVEEYVKKNKKERIKLEGSCLIPLSAKNEERLNEIVQNLIKYLNQSIITSNHQPNDSRVQLENLAYTFQTGREAMEVRLVSVANNLEELKKQLENYQKGNAKNIFVGNVKKEKNDFLLEGEAGEAYIKTAILKKQVKALAQLWVKGVEMDWNLLYEQNNHPNKISLPTYPFAKERYWVPELKYTQNVVTNKLHPLLHSNESDLSEQKY